MKRILTIILTLCMVLSASGISVWADDEEGWQEETPMLKANCYFFTAKVGNKIYLLGGEASYELNQIYDTKTRSWEMGESVPIPTIPIYSSYAVVGDKIYLIGRKNQSDEYKLQIYDTKTNTWISSEDISEIKIAQGLSCTSVGNKIYLITYISGKTKLYIFDTLTEEWAEGSNLPDALDYTGTIAVGSNIYVIGGSLCDSVGYSKTVYIYNTETDTWSRGSDMSYPRNGLTVSANGNNIYAIGGYNGNYLNKVEIYDITTDTWKTENSLNEVRFSCGSAVVNGRLYVMGGRTSSNINLNTMESLQIGDSVNTDKKLSVLLNTGETVQLSVSYNLTDNTNFTWSSTNEAVATVDVNGKVTAVGEGQADIYAQNADGTFKEYIPVKVVPGTADEMRLAVYLTAGDNSNLYLSDDPSLVTWNSMDESIATVSASGEVTAVKKGLAIIQGELEGQTYQIYVRVNG
ncbi:Kelch repeat-containing protein [Anaerovorax odorimutans]|uniref:Kelch repeat-containing protein n=1 Tax=Anaerovorax odorimutans TaxID=109327 RepID=UPI0004001EF5|nr:Ig-like domain-containing protein [Anaerovorax odorimutans]